MVKYYRIIGKIGALVKGQLGSHYDGGSGLSCKTFLGTLVVLLVYHPL